MSPSAMADGPLRRLFVRGAGGIGLFVCQGRRRQYLLKKGRFLEKRQKKKAFFGLEGLRGEEGWEG
jgi:hypothetical protein